MIYYQGKAQCLDGRQLSLPIEGYIDMVEMSRDSQISTTPILRRSNPVHTQNRDSPKLFKKKDQYECSRPEPISNPAAIWLEAMKEKAVAVHQPQAPAAGDARGKGDRREGGPTEDAEGLQQTHHGQHQQQNLAAAPNTHSSSFKEKELDQHTQQIKLCSAFCRF